MAYQYKTGRTRRVRQSGAMTRQARIVYPAKFGIVGWNGGTLGRFGNWKPWISDHAGAPETLATGSVGPTYLTSDGQALPLGITYPYKTGDHYSFDVITGYGWAITEADGAYITNPADPRAFIEVLATRALTVYPSFDPQNPPASPPFTDAGNWSALVVSVLGEKRLTGDLEEILGEDGAYDEQSRPGGEVRRAFYLMNRLVSETVSAITGDGDYEARQALSVEHFLYASASNQYGGLTWAHEATQAQHDAWDASGPALSGGATGGIAWSFTGPGTANPLACAYSANNLSGSFGSITVAPAPANGGQRYGNLLARGSAPLTVGVSGTLRTVDGLPNPDPVDLVAIVCGKTISLPGVTGAFSASATGGGWIVYYDFDSSAFGFDHTETAPGTLAEVSGGWGARVLYASENPALQTAHFAAWSKKSATVISVSQAAQTVVEGAPFAAIGSAGAWSGSGGTLSVLAASGTGISAQPARLSFVTTSQTGAEMRRNYGDGALSRTLGYRYYRIKVRSVGSSNTAFRVTANCQYVSGETHYWDLVTGGDGEWVEREIDLFEYADGDMGQALAAEWRAASWVIGVAGAGKRIEFHSITGHRDGESLVSVLSPGELRAYQSEQNIKPLHGVTDGHLSLNTTFVKFDTGRSPRKISEIAAEINAQAAWTGWSASVAKPPRAGKPAYGLTGIDDFTDADGRAEWLEGGGAVLDRDATGGPVAIASRPYFTAVQFYPGAGDAMNAGGYGTGASVAFEAITRGHVFGALVGGGGDATLLVKNASSGASYGSGLARPSDYAATGAPDAPGRFPGQVTLAPLTRIETDPSGGRAVPLGPQAPPSPSFLSTRIPFRARLWVRFYPPGKVGRDPHALSHPTMGYLAVAYQRKTDKQIRFLRSAFPVPRAGESGAGGNPWIVDSGVTTSGEGASPCLGLLPSGRLLCAWEKRRDGDLQSPQNGNASDVWEAVSDDDGETWGNARMSIENGKRPVICDAGVWGTLRAAFVKSGGGSTGVLKANFQAPGDAAPSATWTLKQKSGSSLTDLVVEDDGFAITQAYEGPGRLNLTCIAPGESAPSNWTSSDDGHTWTRTV